MNFEFLSHWADVLPRDPGHVVAAVGAGGKTEWLDAAAAVLGAEGVRFRRSEGGEPSDFDPERELLLTELGGGAGVPARLPATPPDRFPARTSLIVVLQGLSALGRPAGSVLPGAGEEPWSWDDALGNLQWELGRLPPGVPRLAALLQLDECDDAIGLFAYVGRVMAVAGVPVVTVGDTSGPEPRLRTAIRAEDGPAGLDA